METSGDPTGTVGLTQPGLALPPSAWHLAEDALPDLCSYHTYNLLSPEWLDPSRRFQASLCFANFWTSQELSHPPLSRKGSLAFFLKQINKCGEVRPEGRVVTAHPPGAFGLCGQERLSRMTLCVSLASL